MIRLNSNHIPANIYKATKVTGADGALKDDLTQLKDHEVLTNTNQNELTTVTKPDTSENPETFDIKNQIKDNIKELMDEGYIQTVNCLGVKMSTDLTVDDVTPCGNTSHTPFSIQYENGNNEPIINTGNWTDQYIMDFFGIKLCTIDHNGRVVRYLNPIDRTNYYLPTNGSKKIKVINSSDTSEKVFQNFVDTLDASKIKKIACSDWFIVVLFNNGTCTASDGRFDLSSWKNVKDIAVTNSSIIYLTTTGHCGSCIYDAADGEDISVLNTWTNIVQIEAGDFGVVGLRSDGVCLTDYGSTTPTLQSNSNIKYVNTGHYIGFGTVVNDLILAVKNDGTITSNYPDLYDFSSWTDIKKIIIGDSAIVGLKNDGTIISTKKTYYQIKDYNNISDIFGTDDYLIGLNAHNRLQIINDQRISEIHLPIEKINLIESFEGVKTLGSGYSLVCVLFYENKPRYIKPGTPGWYTGFNYLAEDLNDEYVMLEIPRIYTRKYIKDGMLYLFMTKDPSVSSEWKLHPAFLSEQTQGKTYADKIYIGAHICTFDSKNKLQIGGSSNNIPSLYDQLKAIRKISTEDNTKFGWQTLTWTKFSLLYEMYLLTAQSKGFYKNYMTCSARQHNIDGTKYTVKPLWNATLESPPSLITSRKFVDETTTTGFYYDTVWMGIIDMLRGTYITGLAGELVHESQNKSLFNFKLATSGPYIPQDEELSDYELDNAYKIIENAKYNYRDTNISANMSAFSSSFYRFNTLNTLNLFNDVIVFGSNAEQYNPTIDIQENKWVGAYPIHISETKYYPFIFLGGDIVNNRNIAFFPVSNNAEIPIIATFS